jgi:hypothetical protein
MTRSKPFSVHSVFLPRAQRRRCVRRDPCRMRLSLVQGDGGLYCIIKVGLTSAPGWVVYYTMYSALYCMLYKQDEVTLGPWAVVLVDMDRQSRDSTSTQVSSARPEWMAGS